MDRLKKLLAIPLAYHLALFITMAILFALNSPASMMIVMLELLLGGLVTPMFFAVMSIAHAIIHDGKVYDYIYNCFTYLLIVGIARVAFYFALGGGVTGAKVALACMAVSVGVFALWDCLFAFTDRMMKKRPNGRKSKK